LARKIASLYFVRIREQNKKMALFSESKDEDFFYSKEDLEKITRKEEN